MKLNVKKTRHITLVLGLLMMLAVVLAGCVNLEDVPEIIGGSYAAEASEEVSHDESDVNISAVEGQTEAPVITDVVNIGPTKVAIYGTCAENATIRVTGGVEDAETQAHGTYYIIEVDIFDRNTLLRITAQAGDDDVSPEREIVAHKDATADTLLNGNSVSVGLNSRLYFDKMITDVSGENLYTASQLNSIRDYVSDTVTSYYNDRAGGQEVELIYVLVPNSVTVDLANEVSIFPEGIVKETNNTIYDQINATLRQTRATVIDMLPVLQEAAANEELMAKYGGIYRETDSALSDYGAYLTYREIMNVVAARFPDAAPKTEEDFKWESTDIKGGNLVTYRGLDNSIINETTVRAIPNFSLDYGKNGAGTAKISSLKKYADEANGDYNFFTTSSSTDNISGIAERWLIEDETRTDVSLPSALIYRDYASLSFSDILVERFSKCMLGKSGEFSINLSASGQYASEGDNVVDYIIVIISEENLDTAFNYAVK